MAISMQTKNNPMSTYGKHLIWWPLYLQNFSGHAEHEEIEHDMHVQVQPTDHYKYNKLILK